MERTLIGLSQLLKSVAKPWFVCHKCPNLGNRIFDLSEPCYRFKQLWQSSQSCFHRFESILSVKYLVLFNFGALFKRVVAHLSKEMLQCNNIYARGRVNLLFPVRLNPQKWVYLAITFLAPGPRGVAALVPVSNDKIQITILILGRGALSTNHTC